MSLNTYFNRAEFACHCGCGADTVDAELLQVLTRVRERFGSVTINSGMRCAPHNMAEGGSKGSLHKQGKAADIAVKGVHPNLIAQWLELQYPNRHGIGRYVGRTHIDVRAKKARWDKR